VVGGVFCYISMCCYGSKCGQHITTSEICATLYCVTHPKVHDSMSKGEGRRGVLSSLATLAWLSLCRLLWKCENLSLHRFPAMSSCRVYVLRASTSILSMRTNVLPRVWVTPKIQHFWALCCCITRLDNSTMRCNNHFLEREEQKCLQKATW